MLLFILLALGLVLANILLAHMNNDKPDSFECTLYAFFGLFAILAGRDSPHFAFPCMFWSFTGMMGLFAIGRLFIRLKR